MGLENLKYNNKEFTEKSYDEEIATFDYICDNGKTFKGVVKVSPKDVDWALCGTMCVHTESKDYSETCFCGENIDFKDVNKIEELVRFVMDDINAQKGQKRRRK